MGKKILLDDFSNNYTYVGKALPGTDNESMNWVIFRIDETQGVRVRYAEGDTDYTKSWNNRLSYLYV